MKWKYLETVNNEIIYKKYVGLRWVFMVKERLFYNLEVARKYALKKDPNVKSN